MILVVHFKLLCAWENWASTQNVSVAVSYAFHTSALLSTLNFLCALQVNFVYLKTEFEVNMNNKEWQW